MIFARDKSQMCNNILQFAHVYAWAREHGRSVMSMRFSYKYKYFKISNSGYSSFPMYLFAKYMSGLGLLPKADFKRINCDAEALEKKMLKHKHIVVSGWFVRFYDLFIKYRDEICDLFTIDEKFTLPVKLKMSELEMSASQKVHGQESSDRTEDLLRLGVHIRRGDYAKWCNGVFFYDDEKYASYINRFVELFPDKDIHVYIATNDMMVVEEKFAALTGAVEGSRLHIHLLGGNQIEDLYMLSQCDYLVGPPSTYSLVASMYRDIPFCRMDKVKAPEMQLSNFRDFNHWFRVLNEL